MAAFLKNAKYRREKFESFLVCGINYYFKNNIHIYIVDLLRGVKSYIKLINNLWNILKF